MKRASLLPLLAGLCFCNAPAQQVNKKEIVKSTHTVAGKFVGFEVGDYVHAIIKDQKGKERSFYIGGAALDFYLAAHAKKSGTFTYQVINAYIEEAGSRMDIERLESAKVGKVGSISWWKSESKRLGVDKANKKYQPMVDKLTRKGD